MKREVLPEILDELDPADPRAVRSRKDLRLANSLMQGETWIVKQVRDLLAEYPHIKKIIELGAGEGFLSERIKTEFPHIQVVAVDLVGKPSSLSDDVDWVVSDVLEYDGYDAGSLVIANLFIHHLQSEQLRKLSEMMAGVSAILFAEPHRTQLALMMGRCIFPLINDVTRHDMMVSVRAGFLKGDLPELLGDEFQWTESLGVIGGIRLRGIQHALVETEGAPK